jgi:hypothetical protein
MDIIKFIGAIGIGAVIVKILDIFWLQKVILKNETIKWLRDQRLIYFSEFVEYGSTLALRNKDIDILDFVAVSAKVKLLLNNDDLLPIIDQFVDRMCDLHANKQHDTEEVIHKIQQESKKLVNELRAELLKYQVTPPLIVIFLNNIKKITNQWRGTGHRPRL